jgi:hypothetical protein
LNKLFPLAIALLSCGVAARADVFTILPDRAAQNPSDILDWGSQLLPYTLYTSPQTVETFSGRSVQVLTGGGNMEVFFDNVPSSALAAPWVGNFDDGEPVLWNGGGGPLTLKLAFAERSIGFSIEQADYDPFTAVMQVYGIHNTLLDTLTEQGTSSPSANGSALFLGVRDNTGDNIVKVVVDTFDSADVDNEDFAIDDVSFTHAPEPGFLPIVGAALLSMVGARRRRRKALCAIASAALGLGAMTASAAPRIIHITAPKGGNSGGAKTRVGVGKAVGPSWTEYKAQNHLSAALNEELIKEKSGSGGSLSTPGIQNGTVDTIPYFNSWFLTGTRNSIYTYSMAGQNPRAGGTTTIQNLVIPLIILLVDQNNNPVALFDPTANQTCAPGSDVSLAVDSPIYNAARYPGGAGLPADTGQFVDTQMRAEFGAIRASNWHTMLATPNNVCSGASGHIYFAVFDPTAWVYLEDIATQQIVGEAIDINVASEVYETILSKEDASYHDIPNSDIPVILTDSISAYQGDECCILGFHTAQSGIENPNGILTWIWATFLPPNNIFAPWSDVQDLSHEMAELFNDPFVDTAVADWVDGSATFGQNNLEVGDVIEAMNSPDVIFPVLLSTPDNGLVNYHVQNLALLAWFTRNPLYGGAYSWPNTHTLSYCPHVLQMTPKFCYGEGSGGFFYGPPY